MNSKNKLMVSTMFVTCFLICLHASALFAGTHYVSHTGTATWNQSTNIDTPCSAESALANAVAGDLVYFRTGTYDPGNAPDWNMPAWNPSNSGSDGSPITFKAYPGERPVVLAIYGPSFGSNGKDYIVWDGFIGPGKLGCDLYVRFYNADHCTIQNCEIKGYDQGTGTENNPCISAKCASYLTIKNCKLYGNIGGGHNSANILFYSVDHALVENCEIYDAYSAIFDKDGGQYNTYRYNFIYNNLGGFGIGTESTGPDPIGISVYQNVFMNNSYSAVSIGGNRPKTNISIYNNVIYDSSSGSDKGISIWPGNTDGLQIYNNIMYGVHEIVLLWDNVTNFYSDYSCFYDFNHFRKLSDYYYSLSDWNSGTGYDANSTDSNPNFVNIGGSDPIDYKLQLGSPCKSTGKNGKDMGAYPNGDDGTVIGYTPPGSLRPSKRSLWLSSN